jgi:anti-sigma B factor antagonist
MSFEIITIDEIIIFRICTELVGQKESDDLSEQLTKNLSSGKNNFILDFCNINFFNSSHIGIAVRSFTTVKKFDGNLRISGVNAKIEKIFQVTKLDRILDLYSTTELAVKSFS